MTTLRITSKQLEQLQDHLFPGDGREAVALLICGRRKSVTAPALVAQKVVPIPYDQCSERTSQRVTWSTDIIDELVPELYGKELAIVKVHSHPTGYPSFSATDDRSDHGLFRSVMSLLGDGLPHASVVLLPDGQVFGRVVTETGTTPLRLQVVGDEVRFFREPNNQPLAEFAKRTSQAFGQGTTRLLGDCSAAVVGCSGTGSIVVEQLARLGVGRLVLVDPDKVEHKNLNRILNTDQAAAEAQAFKVDVLASAIERMGLGTEVVRIPNNLLTVEAVSAVAECDFVFGCMDGVEGRHVLNRVATFYVLPYWDVGVKLTADGEGGIREISGAVHYLQPGLSSLQSRGMYNLKTVEAEELHRINPELYRQQLQDGYLRGVAEERPAVISVNMFFASLCVNDFLSRLHPYRNLDNSNYASISGSLGEVHLISESEAEYPVDRTLANWLGRGDMLPMLNRPALS